MKSLLTACFLILTVLVYGQRLKLGPEIGLNLMEMSSGEIGTNYQPGFHGGANVEYQFGEHFSLRSGVFASQKRQSYQSYDSTLVNLFGLEEAIGLDSVNLYSYTTIDRTVAQIYIEIPLLASYHYKQFSVYAGPYFAYMLTARTREKKWIDTPFLRVVDIKSLLPQNDQIDLLLATLPPADETTFDDSKSKSGLRTFDMGIKAGLRYMWDDFGLNVNYQYGIFDYQTTNKDEFENHSYLQVSLNYNFGLGKK